MPASSHADPIVGMRRLDFVDTTRTAWGQTTPRPLVTMVWYPADSGVRMQEIGVPPERPVFVGGLAARDAPLHGGSDKRPLILLSHGTGGSALQMMWLARTLAARGYIAAAVNHHGNTAAEAGYDARGFRLPWERATDVSRVIDQLLANPAFGPRIDATRIGVAGFSLGGYTAAAIVGGRIDLDQFSAFCASTARDATCEPQPEYPQAAAEFNRLVASDARAAQSLAGHRGSFRDHRVRAAVLLAPALGAAFTRESLADINVPTLVFAGEGDVIAPPATNARPIAAVIPRAQLQILPDPIGHYVFMNTCNGRGRTYVPACKDSPGVDRAAIHDQVTRATADFFDESLKPLAP